MRYKWKGEVSFASGSKGIIWEFFNCIAERRSWALAAVGVALALGIAGYFVSRQLQIGVLDLAAPELRANSRYNVDNAFITANFSLSSDVFAVIVKTPVEACTRYATLQQADRLAWTLQQLSEVQATVSLADSVKQVTAGTYEGSAKWYPLSRNQDVLNYGAQQAIQNTPALANTECSVMRVIAYLQDHKAATLDKVSATVEEFIAENPVAGVEMLPAAGSAGIEAAVIQEVRSAWLKMLAYIYGAVAILCLIAFRSWRAVLVALLLAFMFLWNMLGALILIPSLSQFLLPTSAVHRMRPA